MVDNIFKENDNSDIPLVKKLSAFYLAHGKASFYFLCHAALPLFFRLDWLYYLWANFRHDIKTNTQQDVPYHTIADVLQTPFLATIGIALFEMEQGVRDFLLYELEQAFGRAHTEKLASFLQQYAQQCVQQGYEREAHLQSALIIQNPNEASIRIGNALKKAQENQQTQEINRLFHVAQSLGSAVEDKQKGTFIKYEQLASLHYDIQQESKPNAQRYPKLSEKPSKNSMPIEVPVDYMNEVQEVEKPTKKLKRISIQQAPQATYTESQQSNQQQQQHNPFLSVNIPAQKKLSFIPQDFTDTDEIILPNETESLDLSGILIDDSIKEIAQLTELTYLKLSGMELLELTFLVDMQRLEVLDIADNQLTTFKAEYLDLMPNLKELYLFGNPLLDFPEDILRVEGNCLEKLNKHLLQGIEYAKLLIKKAKEKNLKSLDLGYLSLNNLPDELYELENLEILILGSYRSINKGNINKISYLSEKIENLKNLEELYLSDNNIKGIHKNITKLLKLKKISLTRNELIEIPNYIYEILSIESIYLSGNPLNVIEIDKLLTLPNLKELGLNGVTTAGLSEEFYKKENSLDILEQYFYSKITDINEHTYYVHKISLTKELNRRKYILQNKKLDNKNILYQIDNTKIHNDKYFYDILIDDILIENNILFIFNDIKNRLPSNYAEVILNLQVREQFIGFGYWAILSYKNNSLSINFIGLKYSQELNIIDIILSRKVKDKYIFEISIIIWRNISMKCYEILSKINEIYYLISVFEDDLMIKQLIIRGDFFVWEDSASEMLGIKNHELVFYAENGERVINRLKPIWISPFD